MSKETGCCDCCGDIFIPNQIMINGLCEICFNFIEKALREQAKEIFKSVFILISSFEHSEVLDMTQISDNQLIATIEEKLMTLKKKWGCGE